MSAASSRRGGHPAPLVPGGKGRRGPRVGREAARGSSSRRLNLLIALALTSLLGLVVNDHLVPALQPPPARTAGPVPGAGAAMRVPQAAELEEREGRAALGEARPTPLLTGAAAERALREQRRELLQQRLQQPQSQAPKPPLL